jgi:hypothetical protein
MGNFNLTSDSIGHTYSRIKRTKDIISNINPDRIYEFWNLAHTIGAYLIFPSDTIDNKRTINVVRGLHPYIIDRIDFTLECIRLWYLNLESPLYKHLNRYRNFFEIFTDFKQYIDFFLLNDLVSDEDYNIKFLLPFHGFEKQKLYHKIQKNITYI